MRHVAREEKVDAIGTTGSMGDSRADMRFGAGACRAGPGLLFPTVRRLRPPAPSALYPDAVWRWRRPGLRAARRGARPLRWRRWPGVLRADLRRALFPCH